MTWEHIVRRWLSACSLIKTSAEQIQDSKGNVNSEPYTLSLESCSESISDTETKESSEVTRRRRFQTALTVVGKNQYGLVHDFPVPEIQNSDEILIRNHATGLNPIDWKCVDYNFCLPKFPWVTGRECAGIVEEVGSSVTLFKRGDRVWTSTYYKDIRAGCFQEYLVVPAHTVCHVPHTMTLEEAACLGVCALTAAVTLWHWLKISMPSQLTVENGGAVLPSVQTWPPCQDEYVLVWGGRDLKERAYKEL
ncbi:unnamed protein product [Clonostachys byssicola]|uniref:Alcohol dehydrogenase-like N-terminal domain-containing protein n=1 Tax=Clonostachys byssicola TaxID=160290 RepID=A0A9N9UIX5_9HYPO|nr:unnamed protein product [Clonostachys byssicola]